MGICIKRLAKIAHTKFHENFSMGIPLSREVRRTDFMRLIIAFRNCNTKAPKSEFVGIVSGMSTKSSGEKIQNWDRTVVSSTITIRPSSDVLYTEHKYHKELCIPQRLQSPNLSILDAAGSNHVQYNSKRTSTLRTTCAGIK